MVPDFATIRDTTKSKLKKAIYGFFAFGWTGSSREWLRYEGLAFVLGGIAAVLVVSVHSIVSTDFAVSVEPGWHTTLFPPYFVVGAIFSGFAMVLTLVTLMKKLYNMSDFITDRHVDAVCRVLVFISLIMGTAYITEIFIALVFGFGIRNVHLLQKPYYRRLCLPVLGHVYSECLVASVILVEKNQEQHLDCFRYFTPD